MDININRKIIIVLFLLFGIINFSNQAQAAFLWEDNIVAHWKMNDNAANSTVEASIGDYHGTVYNGDEEVNTEDWHIEGKIGGALDIPGAEPNEQRIEILTDSLGDVFNGDQYTISVWAKARTGAYANLLFKIRKWDFPGEPGACVGIEKYCPDGTILFSHYNDDRLGREFEILSSESSVSISDGEWHHIVVSVERGNTATLYVDSIVDFIDLAESEPLPGTFLEGFIGQDFNGAIDNVMIFNRALIEDEVAELYNSGNGTENIYDIAGQITLNGGTANVTDVLLTLSGGTSETTNPDADGNYSFNCWDMFNYTVTPSLKDYYFFPTSYSYTLLNSDQTNQDFTGLHKNYDSDGNGIPDWFEMTFYNNNRDEEEKDDNSCLLTTVLGIARAGDEDGVLCKARNFRDNYLLTNPIGASFSKTYYKISPHAAGFINEHTTLKTLIKNILTPLTVCISEKSIE